MSFDTSKYVYSEIIFNTLYIEVKCYTNVKTNAEKISFGKNKQYKK